MRREVSNLPATDIFCAFQPLLFLEAYVDHEIHLSVSGVPLFRDMPVLALHAPCFWQLKAIGQLGSSKSGRLSLIVFTVYRAAAKACWSSKALTEQY